MTTQRYIFMNGTQFNPTSVDTEEEKVGDSKRMADGTMRYYHRAFKNKWSIKWSRLRESSFTAIRTVAQLTTSFTFKDYDNVSWTVVILPGGFKHTIAADGVDSAGVKRYDVELVLDQV